MANGTHCDPVLDPTIFTVLPLEATVGLKTLFTITGVALPGGLSAEIGNCTELAFKSRSPTKQELICTPTLPGPAKRRFFLEEGGTELFADDMQINCPDCLINGECVSTGTTEPGNQCRKCEPSVKDDEWSDNDAVPCDDGNSCNGSDRCRSGACVWHESCGNRVCGDDGCGGNCGSCGALECHEGLCVPVSCWPNCGEMITVPAGPFWMGCNAAVDSCDSHEKPYHVVELAEYQIDRTEVTQAEYAKCAMQGECRVPQGAGFDPASWPDRPVTGVTWDDADVYCKWKGKRLPTEAEWEKAARGTDGRRYPWGNEPASCEYAVMESLDDGYGCGTNGAWQVCSKSPAGDSPYGLCDMAGNVDEWTADWYGKSYYSSSPGSNPTGPSTGWGRVFRGGAYYRYESYLRVSARQAKDPSDDGDGLGFRCARSIEP